MVWEQKTKLVLMLCPTVNQHNKEECVDYWQVDQLNQQNHLSIPDTDLSFVVKLKQKKEVNPRVTLRIFQVGLEVGEESPFESREQRESIEVAHLQLTGWVDKTAVQEEFLYQDILTAFAYIDYFRGIPKDISGSLLVNPITLESREIDSGHFDEE